MLNDEPERRGQGAEEEAKAGLGGSGLMAYQWFSWNGERRRFKAVMRSPASPAVRRMGRGTLRAGWSRGGYEENDPSMSRNDGMRDSIFGGLPLGNDFWNRVIAFCEDGNYYVGYARTIAASDKCKPIAVFIH